MRQLYAGKVYTEETEDCVYERLKGQREIRRRYRMGWNGMEWDGTGEESRGRDGGEMSVRRANEGKRLST